jgi:hypothetical protein
MEVRALLLGERLDTRALESGAVLATAPLALALDQGGVAVVFRYGARCCSAPSALSPTRFAPR